MIPNFEAFYYGLMNFFLYLTPLYLFFVSIWSERLNVKYTLDKVTNRLFVSLTSLILTIFLLTGTIWSHEQLFVPIFYCFWFIVFLWKLPKWIGGFDAMMISVLCIFTMAEVWEIPIILRNAFTHDAVFVVQNIILSSLKLSSIPILYIITKGYQKYNKTAQEFNPVKIGYWKREAFDLSILVVLVTLAFFSFIGIESFTIGIFIRLIIAVAIYVYVLGFRKVNQK